jgi:ribosomal protein S18 acetylase RimI-like enzyme
MTGSGSAVRLRRGTPDDVHPAFELSMAAMGDLFARQGNEFVLDPDAFWLQLQPILEHVAATAAEWWVAVDESDDAIVGYARSVERGGLFELTELFVRPDRQSAGLGRQLIDRAFPAGRGDVRVLIATTDVRAIARYYAAGTVARFPIASMSGRPRPPESGDADDLEAVAATEADIPELAALETAVVGYPRDNDDYRWLLEHRDGTVYRRAGRTVGFAFVSGSGSGPVIALEPSDQVAILRHAEARAHALGVDELSFEVPMPNEIAMRQLLGRGFRIEPPLTLLMSSVPFGQFDRFIPFGPPIFL